MGGKWNSCTHLKLRISSIWTETRFWLFPRNALFPGTPEHWEDRLLKLKALGCNTVETVVPWNLHEAEKGRV